MFNPKMARPANRRVKMDLSLTGTVESVQLRNENAAADYVRTGTMGSPTIVHLDQVQLDHGV